MQFTDILLNIPVEGSFGEELGGGAEGKGGRQVG